MPGSSIDLRAQPRNPRPSRCSGCAGGPESRRRGNAPLRLTAAELNQLPRQTITAKAHDGKEARYEGVALIEILKRRVCRPATICEARPSHSTSLSKRPTATARCLLYPSLIRPSPTV